MLAALLLAALAVTRALPTEYWGGGDLSSEEFYEAAVEKGEAGHGDRRALFSHDSNPSPSPLTLTLTLTLS